MNTVTTAHKQLMDEINKLPAEFLPELAGYLTSLQSKIDVPSKPQQTGTEFLISIAGIGEAEEDLSERDEEIF